MWWIDEEDDTISYAGLVAVGGVLGALFAAALVWLSPLPFRLVVSAVTFFAVLGLAHWVVVRWLPGEPLGFWKGLAFDSVVGVWLLVTFVALCRAGWWSRLGEWGARWHRYDDCTPDTALAVIGVCFIGWQALRVLEEAPQVEGLPGWVRLDWLYFGLKIALLFGFTGFLVNGGDRWLKSLFQ